MSEPFIGEIRSSRELGYKGNPSVKHIWHACIVCGKQRWVEYNRKNNAPRTTKCYSCSNLSRWANPDYAEKIRQSEINAWVKPRVIIGA